MTDQFVHLHVHTEYSMLDGMSQVGPLIAEAQRLGQPAVAMTDHGNMFGAHEFYHTATKTGITPILGMEAYVAPASRLHKKPVFWGKRAQTGRKELDAYGEYGDVAGAGSYTHLTLLARDATGLRNLFALSSLASFEGMYHKPRIDQELLAQYADGLIATTGCPGSEVSTRLRLGQYIEACAAAATYRDIVGAENYFVELMDHGIDMERTLRNDLLRLARDLNIPVVATNDSHYTTADQAHQHEALLALQSGKTLNDPDRFQFSGGGYYLKSAEEMRRFWDSEVPGAADATLRITEMIGDYSEVFQPVDRMPQAKLSPGQTSEQALRDEVERYIPTRYPDGFPQAHRDQLEWELEVITGKGYASYFLVVGDIVRWARRQGIRVGPGRGSAAGALLSYVLHIIDIDPLRHTLLFERFLNPERSSAPDIDVDFQEDRRDEVEAYACATYGQENFAKVLTYDTIKTKSAFKDAARVHLGPEGHALADRFSKTLPSDDLPLRAISDPEHERYAEAAEVRSMVESDSQLSTIYDTACGLDGLIRGKGVHACAHIISSEPLLTVLPLWKREGDGEIITGFDGEQCDSLGLLKVDLLGVKYLTVVERAVERIRDNHGVDLDMLALPLDDPGSYELLGRGASVGLFQIEGSGMRELLTRMQPTDFSHLIACVSLYRPGPLDVNAHHDYADRKNGRKPVEPLHPDLGEALEPILGDTYGLIVYQEQVMQITQQLAGYSLGDSDALRKAMGKKKKDVIDAEEPKFISGMVTRGFSAEAAKTLWDIIVPFAGYAFNKSHAAAYGLITYWTVYLKRHYPAEFMASLLTAFADTKDKPAVYLAECRRMGLQVLPPDVNESELSFTATADGRIRFGLAAIRNVGTGAAEAIIQARYDSGGSFTSFSDFLSAIPASVVKKRLVESLIKAGAFDEFGIPRQSLTAVHAEAVDAVSSLKKQEQRGQFDLFDGGDAAAADASPLAHLTFGTEEWARKQLLGYEREMLGLYVSAHPLDGADRILRQHASTSIAALKDEQPSGGEVHLAGLITHVARKTSKKGEPWAIVTLEDHDASIEVLFFPQSFSVYGPELVTDAAVAVAGRINWRDDQMSIFGSKLTSIDVSHAEHHPATNPRRAASFVLHVFPDITRDTVQRLRTVLERYPGGTRVDIAVISPQGSAREPTVTLPHHPVQVCPELVGELKELDAIALDTLPVTSTAAHF